MPICEMTLTDDDRIETALKTDLERILNIDPIKGEETRKRKIEDSIEKQQVLVMKKMNNEVIAFAIVDTSFFDQTFVHLVIVGENYRRQGFAKQLMQEIEKTACTPKLFTSTNESNLPARALFHSLGYVESGVIYNLDEGDPEFVLFKSLLK